MRRCKISLVVGSSIDGKISPGRGISSKNFGEYIPEEVSFELHKLRSKVDGILVSSSTVLFDNPSLTVRSIQCKKRPYRIIMDRLGKIPKNSKVLNAEAKTIILTSKQGKLKFKKVPNNMKVIICKTKEEKLDLNDTLKQLKNEGIKNILIEGGGTINYSLFSLNLIDEIVAFIFPFIIGGKDTPTIVDGQKSFYNSFKKMKLMSTKQIKGCLMNTYKYER
ncbi:5-amino-6-(5-phosphoribosylamino)uracil reductase [Candidatus Pacearchaeota archaeon CG10_big_fil_rev_8_21_14_0_10_31_24]|nr:MAG: 5-amino-6-(5-phosphoribosylamino)uracil reductase [Candidatus Pacearchaeota archaeon CG10_big_fil_rev_8_21_14_0_10_31_24]